MKTKDVSFAVLHGPVFVPNAGGTAGKGGQIGPTLDLGSQNRIGQMSLDDGILYVTTKGDIRTRPVTFAVPLTNVSHLVFKEEAKAKPSETNSKG